MNISYKWLKEYVDFDLTPQQTADALTSIGLEVGSVEEVQSVKGGLKGLVVGEVLTCEMHPNSDHLHVCSVNIGEAEPSQIVCGAPNVAAGQKVVVATLGTVLYDGDQQFTIKRSKLRGVESLGMICAEDEIGVGTDHSGIIVLPADTKVGMPAAEYYQLESDYVIEVDITPNRSDACSHYGVARDLYAWLVQNGYKTTLHRPTTDSFRVDNHDLEIDVQIRDEQRCPRYAAVSVTGCHVAESPDWLKQRLNIIGLRPINNIVDITNYIMHAYGQPLHCFDADMIKGRTIIVDTLAEGTPFVTLDGVEHKLSSEDLAICNAEEPMCIAGVFGGKGSGTYETTTNVLFESAYFNPTTIRKSARRHGLSTDASFRFERGIDPNGTIYALKQAAIMACELAGGKVSMEIKDVYPQPIDDFKVELDYQYAYDLMGKEIGKDTIKSILQSLEVKIDAETEKGLSLTVPAYRVDVTRPCDVVEDILRIYGYNNVEIPSMVRSSLTVKGETDRSNNLQQRISEQLTAQGFNEIMNNSLTRAAYYEGLDSYSADHCVRLMNPLSEDLSVMRQTLLFGGLESLRFNVNHKCPNLLMYEFGKEYSRQPKANGQTSATDGQLSTANVLAPYNECMHLGLWITGKRVEGSWAHANEEYSFFNLKGYVEDIFCRLGISLGQLFFKECTQDIYSAALQIEDRNGKVLATLGVVSPKALKLAELKTQVYYADLDWEALMKKSRKNKVSFTEISKYPAVSRDLALLIDKDVTFLQVEGVAYQTERNLLKKVELFDVYEGKNLPAGKKSYAVNFTLQDTEKTLTDKHIDHVMQALINNFKQKLNAELR
ncbi:MAG: phenylalanine--tRNA ligase subunit beta [Bacteroidaceae bacterium]|nr:phenylalanine--tRNA ligase subunit beta [Bacteroidaceae bacterium]